MKGLENSFLVKQISVLSGRSLAPGRRLEAYPEAVVRSRQPVHYRAADLNECQIADALTDAGLVL